ncbi:hypothetical protein Tco_1060177, partial [Tanacetum coccineum]
MMEQQVLSQVRETQLVVVVKLRGIILILRNGWWCMIELGGMHVGIVVYDEVLHKLVSMVEKNELVEKLMIAVVDTEQNLTMFY